MMKVWIATIAAFSALAVAGLSAQSPTIVDEWSSVKAPPAVELKAVKIDAAHTALLLLDFEARTVDPRPRAKAALAKAASLLDFARANGVLVAYSTTGMGSPQSILADVKPKAGELVVKGSVDKFYNTELEKSLKDKGITIVIICGITTEGAVLGSSIGAVLRGFKVIVPVDCTAALDTYAEQYVAWHLLNAPATKGNVTLSSAEQISK